MPIPETADKQMMANVFPIKCLRICGIALAGLVLAGCSDEFSPNGVLESRPVRLDGEQVILDQEKVDCGAHEDLWNIAPLGGGRSVGRLTQKGRDLQFSDDVQVGDPAFGGLPYAQLHGSFRVRVMRMDPVRDEDAFTKVASAKVAVIIDHSCFQKSPPVLMGIRRGQFDPSEKAVFRFKLDGEWLVDQVLH